jgi:transmembrane sensor
MENEKFIQLLTLKLVDELTDAEREELSAIIRKNPELQYRNEILNKFWKSKRVCSGDDVAMFEKLKARIEAQEKHTDDEQIDAFDKPAVPMKFFIKYWQSIAAILLLSIGVCAFYYHKDKAVFYTDQTVAVRWFQKTTKPSVKSIIKLSDGTIVTLNSATTLKYPDSFVGNTREVYLNGEAYFDVYKDHQHPFIIHANKMNIRVLGTSFNVKSYANEPVSETTLIRGSVEITLNDRPSDRIVLKPKEKLIVQNNIVATKKPTLKVELASPEINIKGSNYSLTNLTHFPNNEKTIVETSWVENKLVFTDKDFVELSVQMERWYGVHFVFANDRMKADRFSGMFEKETLSEALNALKIITPFKYKMNNSTVYIY